MSRKQSRILLSGLAMLIGFNFASGALAEWEEPKHWSEIGTVQAWMELDRQFYRVYEDAAWMDKSQFNVNQKKEYEKTFQYRGSLDGILLPDFLALNGDQREKRRKEARKELKFLADFYLRINNNAQQTKQGNFQAPAVNTNDVTRVGEALSRLRTAVSLDPSNPYAWHLMAFFSSCVGDYSRAGNGLDGAEAALKEIPDSALRDMRWRIAMDRAWIQREKGAFEDAAASVATAESYGVRGVEAELLLGLIAAQTGNTQEAITRANNLKTVDVPKFPPNYRSTSFSPDIANVSAWTKRPSGYMQSWILALSWIYESNYEMASAAFGKFSPDDMYPLADKFWNDAGRIYELTGRPGDATAAWGRAHINVPYLFYFVYKPYAVNLGRLTGRDGPVPFLLGFDKFYRVGSRLGFAASMVEDVANAKDDLEKQELAGKALEELEFIQDFGLQPGHAEVLLAQTYYLMGDLESALINVEDALKVFNERGDMASSAAVLQSLSESKADLNATDLANFFSQSGSSRGRWQEEKDPEAALAELKKSYEDDPSDENRRNLARFLIRHNQPEEGRELALAGLSDAEIAADELVKLQAPDMELVLEADRAAADDELALAMVAALGRGVEDPWNDSTLWALAGFICIDNDHEAEGKKALERASELDPGNQGLKIQLAFMGDTGR